MPQRSGARQRNARSKSPARLRDGVASRHDGHHVTNGDGAEHDSKKDGEISHPRTLSAMVRENLLLSVCVCAMITITYCTMPSKLVVQEKPTVQHVWFYGWVAAITTGLGALPVLWFTQPSDFWVSVSSAVAAGMMLSASYSLVSEGVALEDDGSSLGRVAIGVLLGMLFVRSTKAFVEMQDDSRLGDFFAGIPAKKMFLIISVMMLHSFAEGLGMGVAFCGTRGAQTGVFISAALAVHNVPEGLTVALVLAPRGVSKFKVSFLSSKSKLNEREHLVEWMH